MVCKQSSISYILFCGNLAFSLPCLYMFQQKKVLQKLFCKGTISGLCVEDYFSAIVSHVRNKGRYIKTTHFFCSGSLSAVRGRVTHTYTARQICSDKSNDSCCGPLLSVLPGVSSKRQNCCGDIRWSVQRCEAAAFQHKNDAAGDSEECDRM